MYAISMVTFTINIPQMLAHIPYMDPMGKSCFMPSEHQVIHPRILDSFSGNVAAMKKHPPEADPGLVLSEHHGISFSNLHGGFHEVRVPQ